MNPIVEYCGSDASDVAKIVLGYLSGSKWGVRNWKHFTISIITGLNYCSLSAVGRRDIYRVTMFDAIEVITGERLRDDVPWYVLKDYIEEKC